MTYNKEELIGQVASELEAISKNYKVFIEFGEVEEVTTIDVRLRLFEGSYEVKTDDPQYDTDHRGYWGYGSLEIGEDIEDDYKEIAEELVDEALDSYAEEQEVQSNEVAKTHPLQDSKAYDYEFHSYGALTIYCESKDVGFLQGDEAYTLRDELDSCFNNWEVQTILSAYDVSE